MIKRESATRRGSRAAKSSYSSHKIELASDQHFFRTPVHNLNWLLAPFGQRRFFREYWERKPLFIQRNEKEYYASLLSFRDLDSLLGSHHLRLPGLRLVRAKTNIAIQTYSPDYAQVGKNVYGSVDIDRVFAEHQAGATIILEGVHRTSVPLTQFCRELETALSHPVQANLYLTPKAAQGFETHYDTHDVFVVQAAGRKKWRIFRPRIQLPLRSQPYVGDHVPSGSPFQEIELTQGDLLYIPRGYPHEAMTRSRDLSVHITVGVIAYTWYDLFQEAIKEICKSERIFRESLPIGFASQGLSSASNKRQINRLLGLLSRTNVWENSLDSLIDLFISSREPMLDGHLSNQLQLDNIDLATPLKIRQRLLFRTVVDDKTLALSFHGKKLHFPHYAAEAIYFIVTRGTFTAGSIPDCIDSAGKLALVRRLVKEGFLTIE
jgi:bifunctional lysine-specific demethylase and histidyl-hydroxylase MINA